MEKYLSWQKEQSHPSVLVLKVTLQYSLQLIQKKSYIWATYTKNYQSKILFIFTLAQTATLKASKHLAIYLFVQMSNFFLCNWRVNVH